MEDIVILDTCVLFDFLSGKKGAVVDHVEQIFLKAQAGVSAITVFELLRGVESQKHIEQRKELISLCTVLDLTPPIALHAAQIYTHLKKQGSLISIEDILIAATSLHWRYALLTSNHKDFLRISGIKIL